MSWQDPEWERAALQHRAERAAETLERSSKLLPNYDRLSDFTAQRRICFLASRAAKRWPFPRLGKFAIQGGFAFGFWR